MEAYFDVREPGSYGGIDSLYRTMKRKGEPVTYKQVAGWLAEQDAYTLHKPARRRFLRRKTYSRGIDYLWQADLVDVAHLSEQNDGHRYLLTVIDVFSKYAWAIPLKRKDAKSVSDAFDKIFAGGRKPLKLQTDKGKEFINAPLQKKLKDEGVQFYVSQNEDIKASVVERFNRTLKTKMWKYFTHRDTLRYVDVLTDMIASYNDTHHRTIGRAPSSVNSANEADVRRRMYGDEQATVKPKLKVGDKVRISKARRVFDKSYLPNWTEEIFTVTEALRTVPVTYRLKDYEDEELLGGFYENELQPVTKTDEVYKIEKILKTRRRGGIKEYFVKWRGYPEKFNSWIAEADLV